MATLAAVDLYPHIESTPGVRGGRPRLKGTRVSVLDIVGLHQQGLRHEEMLDVYMTRRPLTLADIHASLAYYDDHKPELDAIVEDDSLYFEERLAEQETRDRERSGRP